MKQPILKVEDVNRPLKKGEIFLVPCLVWNQKEVDEYIAGEPKYKIRIFITPVINHPHSDKENGQKETHFHVDYRFVKHENNSNFPKVINSHSQHIYCENIRPELHKDGELQYMVMPVINEEFTGITPVEYISKSKLKHDCIHNGKCPHRGYNLSQVQPKNGVIKCPLHGLCFEGSTGKIIGEQKSILKIG